MARKTTKPTNPRDIEFIYEIGTIRFISRTWVQFLTPEFQDLADHHFRVTWIALVLAKMEGVTNTDKIMKMAIFHDIAESRTGDVNFLQKNYVTHNEQMGVEHILSGTLLEEEFLKLWHEYEKKESIEAQIVKDADNLDVDFELTEQASKGNVLAKEWKKDRREMLEQNLYTTSARKILAALTTANPHDWHNNARHRFKKGDWKKKLT